MCDLCIAVWLGVPCDIEIASFVDGDDPVGDGELSGRRDAPIGEDLKNNILYRLIEHYSSTGSHAKIVLSLQI